MEQLVQLFIEQLVEKRVFASFPQLRRKEKLSEEDLKKALNEPEIKMVLESGADLNKLKEMFLGGFDKSFARLRKGHESVLDQIIASQKK